MNPTGKIPPIKSSLNIGSSVDYDSQNTHSTGCTQKKFKHIAADKIPDTLKIEDRTIEIQRQCVSKWLHSIDSKIIRNTFQELALEADENTPVLDKLKQQSEVNLETIKSKICNQGNLQGDSMGRTNVLFKYIRCNLRYDNGQLHTNGRKDPITNRTS